MEDLVWILSFQVRENQKWIEYQQPHMPVYLFTLNTLSHWKNQTILIITL